MDKFLGVIIAGALLGAAVYLIAKKTGEEEKHQKIAKEADKSFENEKAFEEMENKRSYAAETIYERHEEAAEIMKKAVAETLKTEKDLKTGFCDLEEITDELNELLKEG